LNSRGGAGVESGVIYCLTLQVERSVGKSASYLGRGLYAGKVGRVDLTNMKGCQVKGGKIREGKVEKKKKRKWEGN